MSNNYFTTISDEIYYGSNLVLEVYFGNTNVFDDNDLKNNYVYDRENLYSWF